MATIGQSIYDVRSISDIIQLHVLHSLVSCAVSTCMHSQPSAPIQERFRPVQALILSFMKEGEWKVSPEHSEVSPEHSEA
jgi:hypothetical protein